MNGRRVFGRMPDTDNSAVAMGIGVHAGRPGMAQPRHAGRRHHALAAGDGRLEDVFEGEQAWRGTSAGLHGGQEPYRGDWRLEPRDQRRLWRGERRGAFASASVASGRLPRGRASQLPLPRYWPDRNPIFRRTTCSGLSAGGLCPRACCTSSWEMGCRFASAALAASLTISLISAGVYPSAAVPSFR